MHHLESTNNCLHSIDSRTLTRDSMRKSSSRSLPLKFDAIVDERSGACVFNCCREFSSHSIQPTEKTATVSEKCSGKPSANGVPIGTIAAVANTTASCSVILLFHNVAHAESNDTKILLSSDQMKKGGVDCKLIDMDQTERENNGFTHDEWLQKDGHKIPIKRREMKLSKKDSKCFPHTQLSPPTKTQLRSLKHITMTEPGNWCPEHDLRAKAKCSHCGNAECRRRQCIALHSFGMGVQNPQEIEHGKCWVCHTKKKCLRFLSIKLQKKSNIR